MLEQLSSRFELVVEAVSGIGGRIDTLRGEMVEQFAEVGKQIRFLSQQIGENRDGLTALRAELTAEIVRLGEALGATRVEFRQQMAEGYTSIRQEIAGGAQRTADKVREKMAVAAGEGPREIREEIARSSRETRDGLQAEMGELRDGLRAEIAGMQGGLRGEVGAMRDALRAEISLKTEAVTRHLSGELKQTQKSLGALSKKFDRFDDRVSVQVKDQDQRLRKVERRARG